MIEIPTPEEVLNPPELDHVTIDSLIVKYSILKFIRSYNGKSLEWYYTGRSDFPSTKELSLINMKLNQSGWHLEFRGHKLGAIGEWPIYKLKKLKRGPSLKFKILQILRKMC